MSESTSSSEFLFGVEEYLKFQKQDKLATLIHSVASLMQKDNSPLGFAKGFLNNLGGILESIEINDLRNLSFDFSKALESLGFI